MKSLTSPREEKKVCCKRCFFECDDPDMGHVVDCLFFDCVCHDSENLWENVIKVAEHYKITDLGNGWSGRESGPCCEQCRIKKGDKIGNMTALIGCYNPFQLKESGDRKLCQCHIPYRENIQKRVNDALDRVIKYAKSRN